MIDTATQASRTDLLVARLARLFRLARGLVVAYSIRMRGGRVGRRLELERGVVLRHPLHEGLMLGDDVYIGVGAVLDVPRGARLIVADRVKLMHYVCLAAAREISIGSDSQIAERTTVRDADHGTRAGFTIQEQRLVIDSVRIGADVWIGCGVAVLRGTHIEDGAVVGANSVVKGHVGAGVIVAGIPARPIRFRE